MVRTEEEVRGGIKYRIIPATQPGDEISAFYGYIDPDVGPLKVLANDVDIEAALLQDHRLQFTIKYGRHVQRLMDGGFTEKAARRAADAYFYKE